MFRLQPVHLLLLLLTAFNCLHFLVSVCVLLLLVLTAVSCLHFLVLICVSKLSQQVDNHFDWSRILSSIFRRLGFVT